jgi:RNA polymerase sigma-70 factor (ECF subfamily)
MVDSPSTRPRLLVRLRDPRDGRAWEEFLEVYSPLILQLARRKGLQDADAADRAQDVFRAVARAIDRFDLAPGRGSFRAWLFRISRNLIVNQVVARRRHLPATAYDRLEDLPAPSEKDTTVFLAEYRRRVFAWAAHQVRGELREQSWRTFWMAGVEGKSAREVAEALRTTVGVGASRRRAGCSGGLIVALRGGQ